MLVDPETDQVLGVGIVGSALVNSLLKVLSLLKWAALPEIFRKLSIHTPR